MLEYVNCIYRILFHICTSCNCNLYKLLYVLYIMKASGAPAGYPATAYLSIVASGW